MNNQFDTRLPRYNTVEFMTRNNIPIFPVILKQDIKGFSGLIFRQTTMIRVLRNDKYYLILCSLEKNFTIEEIELPNYYIERERAIYEMLENCYKVITFLADNSPLIIDSNLDPNQETEQERLKKLYVYDFNTATEYKKETVSRVTK